MQRAGQLYPFLVFNGNCREAMKFYQHCLGGDLQMQSLADSPFSGQLPGTMKNRIVSAVLQNDQFALLGSDLLPDEGRVQGNNITIFFCCAGRENFVKTAGQLSGNADDVMRQVHHAESGTMVSFADRFGNSWVIELKLEN